MYKKSFLISFLISVALVCSAQVPQKFNYQPVVRDVQQGLVKDRDVGFRMSILEGSMDGSPVYEETHMAATNAYGVANLVVGEGSVISGSFTNIPWGEQNYFLKVEVDPTGGTAYEHVGTSQLISVPYALYSANLSSPTQRFTIQEDEGHPVDSALFEVRNTEGQTVFAVYPEGTRIYILDEDAKGRKGGFAVGGYSRNTKGVTQEYLRVTPDSIRIYFDEESTKGRKGGFAIGGYSRSAKRTTDHYFMLKPDSAMFLMVSDYPDETASGALTVSTKTKNEGDENDGTSLIKLTRANYFIGHLAGSSITTGDQNCFIGFESGLNNTEGSQNTFLGLRSGWKNTSGHNNIFVGVDAGYDNTEGSLNTMVGFEAGQGNTTGNYNSFFGDHAGHQNKGGDLNTYYGAYSGEKIQSDGSNTFVGAYTGSEVTTGIQNVYIGMRAGSFVGSDFNTFVGAYAGSDEPENGGRNTFIGSDAGRSAKGEMNTFIGQSAGVLNSGSQNTCIGSNSGRDAAGMWNTFVGENSGWFNRGNSNIFLGSGSGAGCINGSENIFIGQEAGTNNGGNRNVFIGHNAGMNVNGSEMFIVNNSDGDSTSALVWGRFDKDIIRINNSLGIGMNVGDSVALAVAGEAVKEGTSDWTTTSDTRVKTDISTVENGLEQIMKLRPVTFRYTDTWREANPGIKDRQYYSFVAQEFGEVFPESVTRGEETLDGDPEPLLRMNSQPAQVVAIRAIQELTEQVREQQTMLEQLQEENMALRQLYQDMLTQ